MEMPYLKPFPEMTQKEFWTQAYLASLHRINSEDAVKEADAALKACNDRWSSKRMTTVKTVQYPHHYPLGQEPLEHFGFED